MTDRITPESARKLLEQVPAGQRWATVFHHGALELEYYAPERTDPQKPHKSNEVYFVISGKGTFVYDNERRPFGPGEVIYVPAGVPHRFEDFSADFATWAIFSR
jgi:mannose-6-phosphate isomerase-like protein (cupin superfamily)